MIETTNRTAVARWGRAGALYDLVASAAFLMPWTATAALGLFADVDDALGLPGGPLPAPTTMTLLFATLFGTVVVMWSIVRWLRPEPTLIAADTVGRAVFGCWFAWALWRGGRRRCWCGSTNGAGSSSRRRAPAAATASTHRKR